MFTSGLILLIGYALGVAFGRRRRASAFPSARAIIAPKALPAPSGQSALPPPSKEALCDLAGILVLRAGAIDSGGWVREWYVEKDGHRIALRESDTSLLETLYADTTPRDKDCVHCGKGPEVSIYLTTRESGREYGGTFVIATYCEKCGEKKMQWSDDEKAKDGVTPRVVGQVYKKPLGPFDDMSNLYDVLYALAQAPGRLMKEVRVRRLSEEYGRLQPRVKAVAKEIADLERGLKHRLVHNMPGRFGMEARLRGLFEEYQRIQPPVAHLVEEINALRDDLLANGVRPHALPARAAYL